MHPPATRRVAGSLIAVLFVSGVIISTIMSEHYTLPHHLLKPGFWNDITRAVASFTRFDGETELLPFYATFPAHSECLNVSTPPIVRPNRERWLPISEAGDAFVYSAFYDSYGNKEVTVVGISAPEKLKVTCQLWYVNVTNGTVSMLTSPAKLTTIPGGEGHPFRTRYFQCAVHHKQSPFAVSIVSGSDVCASPSNVLHVYQPHSGNDTKYNFTICPEAVLGPYPTVQRLIEWIEMHRLLGVQFFTIHNHSIHKDVAPVFRKYEQMGVLEILEWNRPNVSIPNNAQIASMHDCLNRNKIKSKYTAFNDLDEIIVPHHPKDLTWEDMFNNRLPYACSYSFRCSFFVGNYTKPSDLDGTGFSANRSYVLNNLVRKDQIFRHRDRSKVIVRPTEIQFVGTHLSYKCTRKQKPMDVNDNIGHMHHYRNDRIEKPLIRDDVTLKYKALLGERLKQAASLFPEYSSRT